MSQHTPGRPPDERTPWRELLVVAAAIIAITLGLIWWVS